MLRQICCHFDMSLLICLSNFEMRIRNRLYTTSTLYEYTRSNVHLKGYIPHTLITDWHCNPFRSIYSLWSIYLSISAQTNRGGGKNAPGIPGACAAHSFTYLARGPSAVIPQYWDGRGSWNHSLMTTMTNSCCISNDTVVDGVTIQFQWNSDGRFIYDGNPVIERGPFH